MSNSYEIIRVEIKKYFNICLDSYYKITRFRIKFSFEEKIETYFQFKLLEKEYI